MGGVPTKHHTHSKTGRRRSHLALKPGNLSVCPNCGGPTRPHRYCLNCGFYKTRTVKQPR
ncbi:MAG: 50S ribosomal protein L32 [Candidatus Paceibacterota bacterium]